MASSELAGTVEGTIGLANAARGASPGGIGRVLDHAAPLIDLVGSAAIGVGQCRHRLDVAATTAIIAVAHRTTGILAAVTAMAMDTAAIMKKTNRGTPSTSTLERESLPVPQRAAEETAAGTKTRRL